jgi:hypothetical protein
MVSFYVGTCQVGLTASSRLFVCNRSPFYPLVFEGVFVALFKDTPLLYQYCLCIFPPTFHLHNQPVFFPPLHGLST